MMAGMNKNTGKSLSGIAHLRQSIADILSTPIGTRVMRRDYGSMLFELIDQPDNGTTQVRIFAATAEALLKWEPRLKLTHIKAQRANTPGRLVITLTGYVLQSSQLTDVSLNLDLTIRGGV
jgi:phage baseplate assembly protein W